MSNSTDNILQLKTGLEMDYNPDHWSDNIKTEMGELIDRLDDKEWDKLSKIWKDQRPTWQSKLAEAAFLSDQPRVIPLLVSMLRTESSAVGAAVARTLVEKEYFWDPSNDLIPDIKRLLDKATIHEKNDLLALLKRLPH